MSRPARVLVVGSSQTASDLQTAVISMGFVCNIVYCEDDILKAISEHPVFLLAVQVAIDEHVICHRPFPVARLVALCNSCKQSPAILGILPEIGGTLRQRCFSAGFADVMFSPISADTLYESICSLNHCRISESTQLPSQSYFSASTSAHEARSTRDMPTACNLDMGHDHLFAGASTPIQPAVFHQVCADLVPDFMETNTAAAAIAPTPDRVLGKRPAAAAFAECGSYPTSRRRELVPCL
uniref:Response regulatory domain-containing protein n=1 Tax=Cryptomonas curvata TaxID=233186 RepID=A0A7S0LYB8_9CRYP|mmetsp:Transcript_1574/g.3254  ORF Transcript_1574/g.3254 Transcript_1574/m.3254 type:complete len:240 (+) Transcript_1574:1-720(+)